MRDIKFRWWNPDKNIMMSWYEITHDLENSLHQYMCQDEDWLMQFTGLKDKNGKDIYEGDILKGEGVGFFRNFKVDDIDPLKDYSHIPMWTSVEVIGNIHESPELFDPA